MTHLWYQSERSERVDNDRRFGQACDRALADPNVRAIIEQAILAALKEGPLDRAGVYAVIRQIDQIPWHELVFTIVRNLVASGQIQATADIAFHDATLSLPMEL